MKGTIIYQIIDSKLLAYSVEYRLALQLLKLNRFTLLETSTLFLPHTIIQLSQSHFFQLLQRKNRKLNHFTIINKMTYLHLLKSFLIIFSKSNRLIHQRATILSRNSKDYGSHKFHFYLDQMYIGSVTKHCLSRSGVKWQQVLCTSIVSIKKIKMIISTSIDNEELVSQV